MQSAVSGVMYLVITSTLQPLHLAALVLEPHFYLQKINTSEFKDSQGTL